jgi:hypothetical protein
MAKRQNIGLPKKDRRAPDEPIIEQVWLSRLLGDPTTREERNEALNGLLIRSTQVIGVVIVLIIAIALAFRYLITPNQAVATVNGERITVSEFRERIGFEQAYILQQYNARLSQLEQQAAAFGIEVDQLAQNDQQLQQWAQEFQFVDILGQRVIDDMIEDEIIRQELDERDITVDEDRIQQRENDFFGYDPTEAALIGADPTETPIPTETPTPFVSPTPSPTPLPTATQTEAPEEATEEAEEATETVDEPTQSPTIVPSPTLNAEQVRENFEESQEIFRENIRQQGGVGNSAVEAFFAREARRQALAETLFGSDTATYVNARHILVETQQEADAIAEALENGESFAAIARAQSTDTQSGGRGGELGWAPAANYVSAFRDAVLSAEIGALVTVESEFGFHVLQVRAREERDVEGAERDRVVQSQFASWLEAQVEASEENITINNNWPNFVE